MMTKTLAQISEAMRDIDFCTLATIAENGAIASRPMSNNREVEYDGDSWFFASDGTTAVTDVERNPRVGLTLLGSPGIGGLFGKPGQFIHIEGRTAVVRDKGEFARHWHKSLEFWWPDGIDTPGLVLLRVSSERIHYWDGEDQGEIVRDTAAP